MGNTRWVWKTGLNFLGSSSTGGELDVMAIRKNKMVSPGPWELESSYLWGHTSQVKCYNKNSKSWQLRAMLATWTGSMQFFVRWMSCYTMRRSSGDSDPKLSGFRKTTKIPSIFTRGQARDDERIIFRGWRTKMGCGKLMRAKLLRWLRSTIGTSSQQPTRQTWVRILT